MAFDDIKTLDNAATPLEESECINTIAKTVKGLNDAVIGLSVSGKTITYTQADGGKGTITTQDTVYTHPNSGVTAGTYRSVTVNAQGHVTGGSNPTITIAQGGTGATTVAAARNALGLGNTSGSLPIANGGTGATSVAAARNALGLGNTSGALPIANGGTGATTAAAARANLGIKDIAAEGTDYIVETYQNGTEWYRVWKSGWIEQGGVIPLTSSAQYTIDKTFLKPFADTTFYINVMNNYTGNDNPSWGGVPLNVQTTGFRIGKLYSTTYCQYACWYACGKGA